MREIARIQVGDHLHGTATKESRRHYIIVYIPTGDNILLQHAEAIDASAAFAMKERLRRDEKLIGDFNLELLSLRRYLQLVCRGRFPALDAVFAPRSFHIGDPAGEWFAIQTQLQYWLCSNTSPFSEYLIPDIVDWEQSPRAYEFTSVQGKVLEMMMTGKITYPRPDAKVLKAIRRGKIPVRKIEALLTEGAGAIKQAAKESELPREPNWSRANRLVANFYRSAVLSPR